MSIVEMSCRERTKREQEAFDMGRELGRREAVRHGRWKPWSPKILGMEYSYDTMECNLCGKTLHNARLFANYCPNCGAKMDGGSHEP